MQIWLFLYHAKKKKKTGSDGKKRLLTFFCNSGDLKKNVLRLSLLSNWSTNIIDIALPVIVWMGWNQINRQEFHVVHLKEAVSDQFKDCTVLFIYVDQNQYLILSFQGERINLANVVGFRSGIVIIPILDDVARSIISEIGHSVVEKSNCPEENKKKCIEFSSIQGPVSPHVTLILNNIMIFNSCFSGSH